MSGKSYSQRKRDKLSYRDVYFRHNPGLFGCIWSCAYCHRPLLGKQNVVVDHIIPLNNPLGRNTRFNLVAACRECNSRKSDKVDTRIAEGYLFKIIESVVFFIQRIFIVAFVAIWWVVSSVCRGMLSCIQSAFRVLPLPVKLIVVCAVICVLTIRLR